MTPFIFEHVFLAASPEIVLAAFLDPGHVVEQDRALGIVEREVIELVDTPELAVRASRVLPRVKIPSVVRRFAPSPEFVERITWKRPSPEADLDIRLLGGRGHVTGRYTLDLVEPGKVRRRYAGQVSVDISLIGTRVERGIIAEFERSLVKACAFTQGWLDRQSARLVAARA